MKIRSTSIPTDSLVCKYLPADYSVIKPFHKIVTKSMLKRILSRKDSN
jgi:hypothetical protein